MKKIYKIIPVSIIILIMETLKTNAQFYWVFETGVNGSTQSYIDNVYVNDGVLTNFNFGLTTYLSINNGMSIKSGINYEGKGRKLEVNGASPSTITQNLSYISLPLKTEYSLGEKAGFKNRQSTDNKNEIKNTDFGWSFELGMKFPMMEKKDLLFSVNYDMGFSKISKLDPDLRNKTVSFNFGILF